MKNLIIAALIVFPFVMWGQEDAASQTAQPKHFRSADKLFNDWSLYAFGGTALIQDGDLTSIKNGVGDWNFGYDFQFGVNKTINHAFGLILQYQMGKTKQEYVGTWKGGYSLHGQTEYQAVSLIGDLNFTSLFRRFDNLSPYKWALHGYLGVGSIGYEAKSNAFSYEMGIDPNEEIVINDEDLGLGSFFATAGVGLKYKISRRIDLEARIMYNFTGDEEFDGSGDPVFLGGTGTHVFSPADIEEQRHDNFLTAGLGINLKLGKHDSHLMWEYWKNPPIIDLPEGDFCETGDADQDSVCDDWDKCLETPAGARIDGSGCALDTDLDGIIDLYDRCVTTPGIAKLQGCPEIVEVETLVGDQFEGIEFELDKADLRPVSFPKLDNAANLIIKYGKDMTFAVEGHTDTRGNDEYNLELSQRRAQAVVDYLVSKGVPSNQLTPKGFGESQLLYPECQDAEKCKREGKEYLNERNRRVVFKILSAGDVNNSNLEVK